MAKCLIEESKSTQRRRTKVLLQRLPASGGSSWENCKTNKMEKKKRRRKKLCPKLMRTRLLIHHLTRSMCGETTREDNWDLVGYMESSNLTSIFPKSVVLG